VLEQIEKSESVSNLLRYQKIKFNVGPEIKYSLKGSYVSFRSDVILPSNFPSNTFQLAKPNLKSRNHPIKIQQSEEFNLTLSTQGSVDSNEAKERMKRALEILWTIIYKNTTLELL